MITAKAFAGKHYAVLGLGRSGLATLRALNASDAHVTAWDDKAQARSKVPDGIEVVDFAGQDLSRFDAIIVTPGLPLNRHPIAAAAKAAGVEIIGDIELFSRARAELPPHKVVGITGTNGKSTTTALVHHILKTAGVPTTMGGNIGLPILEQDPLTPNENGVGVYVLELSSYQIDLTKSLDCDVAVLLNITPDHLDRYESYIQYARSKGRLFNLQSFAHLGIFGEGEMVDAIVEDLEEAWEQNVVRLQPGPLDQSDWPALQGPHNAQNAKAAASVCHALGVSKSIIAKAFRSYGGLPHRMERIREIDGVLFVNDSKATNAEAAAPALAAYPRVRWIVGGLAKTEELGETAKHLGHVVQAYTIGKAGPLFAALLRAAGIDVSECESLENAVERAAEDSQSGETVLLSPAAASFDQFRDFEARGDRFRELVEGL